MINILYYSYDKKKYNYRLWIILIKLHNSTCQECV